MERKFLLGADAGTGGFRVGIYDFRGKELGSGSVEYETVHKHPGWAEQNPDDWCTALKEAIAIAFKKSGVDKEEILAMAVDTHSCSPVLCKRDGTHVRDSLIWMDVRAAEYSKEIEEKTGYSYIAEWMPPKLLWLKNNEPENYEKADIIADCCTYMVHKLTGKWSAAFSNAGVWGLDPEIRKIDADFYKSIGLGDALEKYEDLTFHMSGEAVGTVTKEAAEIFGLSRETIVAIAGSDSPTGMIGMGVVEPGKLALITGSSHLVMCPTYEPFGAYVKTVHPVKGQAVPGYHYASQGQVSTGSITSWFKREFCADLDAAAEKGAKPTYKVLDEMAADVPVGSEGLLMLEYFQGNRHPYQDPNVRGLFYGLSLNHTRGHMFRAIMEGIAMGTNRLLDEYRETGMEIKEMNIAGGASYSDIFLQIHADTSGCVLNVPREKQACTLGSAICAAIGAGVYSGFSEAVKNMVHFEKTVHPIPENVEKYAKIYRQYKAAYPLFKDWMHETSALINK